MVLTWKFLLYYHHQIVIHYIIRFTISFALLLSFEWFAVFVWPILAWSFLIFFCLVSVLRFLFCLGANGLGGAKIGQNKKNIECKNEIDLIPSGNYSDIFHSLNVYWPQKIYICECDISFGLTTMMVLVLRALAPYRLAASHCFSITHNILHCVCVACVLCLRVGAEFSLGHILFDPIQPHRLNCVVCKIAL